MPKPPKEPPNPRYVCTLCWSQFALAKRVKWGDSFSELILWCFLLLPGLFYSHARWRSERKVCPECGSRDYVPIATERGRQLSRELAIQQLNDKMSETQH